MSLSRTRREFVRDLGISAAAVPFLLNLPGLAFANQAKRKQRIVFVFSPNGIVPKSFWPDEEGADFKLKDILAPLEPFKKQTLTLYGMCDRIRGDGDGHMRGIGCLLTGIELFPGNVQGGSDTPAGWAKGLSIDQEIKNYLQADAATKTRFGSLELGVMVPERADTWTRWTYAVANKPLTPIDDPYQLFNKLYGRAKDNEALASVLDDIKDDLKIVGNQVGAADKKLLEEHAAFVRDMEKELKEQKAASAVGHPVPKLEPGMKRVNENMPQISKTQIDLLVNSFAADFARVATYQITNSVGEARMKWLGVDEGHHSLSHEPDTNEKAARETGEDQQVVLRAGGASGPAACPKRRSRAARGTCWTTRSSCGRTSWARATRTRWTTSHSSSSAAASISKWAGASSSRRWPTTACSCP